MVIIWCQYPNIYRHHRQAGEGRGGGSQAISKVWLEPVAVVQVRCEVCGGIEGVKRWGNYFFLCCSSVPQLFSPPALWWCRLWLLAPAASQLSGLPVWPALSLAVAVQGGSEWCDSRLQTAPTTPTSPTTPTTQIPTRQCDFRGLVRAEISAVESQWQSCLVVGSLISVWVVHSLIVNQVWNFHLFSNWKQEADSDEPSVEEEADTMEHSKANI